MIKQSTPPNFIKASFNIDTIQQYIIPANNSKLELQGKRSVGPQSLVPFTKHINFCGTKGAIKLYCTSASIDPKTCAILT